MEPLLIAIDWGSTSCRAWLVSSSGAILAQRDSDVGIISHPTANFSEELGKIVAPWRATSEALPVIVSGMAGSRTGLAEVPYLPCPAGLSALGSALYPLDHNVLPRCWIVPGLRGLTPQGVADVMRGEEVQIFGTLQAPGRPIGTQLLILPGTHSKWVQVRRDEVDRFATAVTGELYASLRRYGSLAAFVDEDDGPSLASDGFHAALVTAAEPGGLLHHLFGLRASALLEGLPSSEVSARLSGLIIGHEVQAMLPMFSTTNGVLVIGESVLAQFYVAALAYHGVDAEFVEGREAAIRGAISLSHAGRLVRA